MPKFYVKIENWQRRLEAPTKNKAKSLAARTFKEEFKLDIPVSLIYNSVRASKTGSFFTKRSEALNLAGVSNSVLQWLCGFWEGDGTLTLINKTMVVNFSQKDSQLLYYIKTLLNCRERVRWGGQSGVYVFNLSGALGALPLLQAIAEYLVCPKVIERVRGIVNGTVTITEHKPTMPWIVGFFDAEGSFSVANTGIEASFSQKDRRPLDKITALFTGRIICGYRDVHRLSLEGPEARRFFSVYLRYSPNVQKKLRLLALLKVYSKTRHVYKDFLDSLGGEYDSILSP